MSILRAIATGVGIGFCFFVAGCGEIAIPLSTPNISQILPQTLTAGSHAQTMKVVGTNFTNEAVILWNGNKLATSVVDSNTLVGTVDSSSLAVPAVVQLKVQNRQTGRESQPVAVTVASAQGANSPVTSTPPSVGPLSVSTTQLPSGTSGSSYSVGLAATGGTPGYTWSITSGRLPAGMSLSAATGLLSGTPTESGTFSIGVTVTDSGSPAQAARIALTLTMYAQRNSQATLTIQPVTLTGAAVASAYSGALSATGGTAPYVWSVSSGRLPGGLSLSTSTGVISGTPTTNGAFSFTVKVTDSGRPAQSASATVPMIVAAVSSSSLTIMTSSLPSATDGTAYSQALQAIGGTPAYTWSITAGSLPAGLTMAATTGVISGVPSGSGTSSFTATVSDNGSPVQSKSVAVSLTVSQAQLPSGPGTTWYVRPDGGTRYSANVPSGQCDGKADLPYAGTGTNQHCAFGDYRFLYDDQSYQNHAWVIAGGDTVILRGGPWRVGVEQGKSAVTVWCNGMGNPYTCNNPTIPAGTPTQHTRILGANYGNCNQSNMTQLFGGYGLWSVLNLSGAQNVDVECIELTRHSQCVTFGIPAYPSGCHTSIPLDDYAKNGITTDVGTRDLLLQDMWIHGFTSRGIIGPIGGLVTATRVDIAYNGGAGWDFDDGKATPMVNGVLSLNYSTIEWSGCNQAYPGTGAISCYGQSNGGYGDGIGTPAGTCVTAKVDHSTFRYNTQDGFDMLHNDTGNCSMTITNSTSYGNNGQQFKWGGHDDPLVFTNNTVVDNCRRLSAPMAGQPSSYNTNLGDFCRAGDAVAFNFRQGGTAFVANNTFVAYAPTIFDIGCTDSGGCSNSTLTFKDNIVLAYANSAFDYGGNSGPGLFFYGSPIGNVVRSNNVYYGIGHGFKCTGYPNEYCQSPLLVNQPIFTGDEQALDNFDFHLTAGSPAKGAGISIPGVTLDFSGAVRGNPPSIGAFE